MFLFSFDVNVSTHTVCTWFVQLFFQVVVSLVLLSQQRNQHEVLRNLRKEGVCGGEEREREKRNNTGVNTSRVSAARNIGRYAK